MLSRVILRSFGFIAVGSLLVCAWDGAISSLGISESSALASAKRALIEENGGAPNSWALSAALRKAWQNRSAAERAQQAHDLAVWAKDFVSTPAFETAYNGWIKERFNAVDHGLKGNPTTAQAAAFDEKSIEKLQVETAVTMARSFMALPPASLQPMFDGDLENWSQSTEPKEKQLAAKAKALKPLLQSNPEEFRKQYALLKSFEMGGPGTWDAFQKATLATDQSQANAKQMEEQSKFNDYRLKVQLKKRLQAFVALARQVDYAAETKVVGNRRIFVNPAYEKKSDDWKRLYRAGKEPVMAAASVAEQWIKEL